MIRSTAICVKAKRGEDVAACDGKAIQIYCDQEDHEIIELRNHGKMMYIRQADIIYAERQDRIVQIHTAQGTYQCYQSLTKIMKLLGRNFLRCHGGYVVNYNYIDTVMRESVICQWYGDSDWTDIPDIIS